MTSRFTWDPKKAASNLKRHAVSFEEAITVFANPLARIFDEENHSVDERREIIIGHSAQGRLLVICFRRRTMSVKTMKKASRRKGAAGSSMRREYRFDYRKARLNRFATVLRGRTAVVLDPDVATVFGSSKSVNQLLRSVIAAFPGTVKARRARG